MQEQRSGPHPVSGRFASVDDDGDSAWLLLRDPDGKIVADCWLYNRRRFEDSEIESWARDRQPPAPDLFVGPGAVQGASLVGQLTFRWSPSGASVAVARDTEILGFIWSGERRGKSRNLVKAGPWGAPFDPAAFQVLFPEALADPPPTAGGRILGLMIGGMSGVLVGTGFAVMATVPALPAIGGLTLLGAIMGAKWGPAVWRAMSRALLETMDRGT